MWKREARGPFAVGHHSSQDERSRWGRPRLERALALAQRNSLRDIEADALACSGFVRFFKARCTMSRDLPSAGAGPLPPGRKRRGRGARAGQSRECGTRLQETIRRPGPAANGLCAFSTRSAFAGARAKRSGVSVSSRSAWATMPGPNALLGTGAADRPRDAQSRSRVTGIGRPGLAGALPGRPRDGSGIQPARVGGG